MTIRILNGDCRDVLRTSPDASVHCVVTSPPYWGLRDYGTAEWEGGDPACEHKNRNYDRGERADRSNVMERTTPFRSECGHCGARRIDRQIGLEPGYAEFVNAMVGVFREVRRVLRCDGTLWLNLGDSYASGEIGRHDALAAVNGNAVITCKGLGEAQGKRQQSGARSGLPPKNLVGIPWRVAFALQADGWYLRQDIIWSKPNPMPESVTDRCTKAHEYLFLLSKSERYFYDAAAIEENTQTAAGATWAERKAAGAIAGNLGSSDTYQRGVHGNGSAGSNLTRQDGKRNKRSVWEVATQPFSEAHFATFPPALIEPCILAGCPKGGTVLDPFGGAGTTGLVADRLGRNAILIELNPAYADMAKRRIEGDAPLFAEVT